MQHESCKTGRDGNLAGRFWASKKLSDDAPEGVVIVVHGLGDHAARFSGLADRITETGWSVFAFELPGHGQSPGTPGRISSYDAVLQDIAAARRTAGRLAPAAPQVLLGHSMGGNFALNYVLRQDDIEPVSSPLAGLVMCAPMLSPPRPLPRPIIFAAWLTGRLAPWIRFSREVAAESLTSDPVELAAINDDPAMHSSISLYLATQLVSQGRWALDQARNVALPTLVMYGERDTLIDRSACENVAIRIGKNASLVKFTESRHSLFHDIERDQVIRHLQNWLVAISQATTST